MNATQPTIAPDGVVEAFLQICARTTLVPNADAEAWLESQGLIGSPNGVIEPTPKGVEWLAMILATPVPIQVSAYRDPREFDRPVAAASADAGAMLLEVLRKALAVPAAPAPPPPAPGEAGHVAARAVANTGPVELLPGFQPNTVLALEAGVVPYGLARDTEVIVQLANGKMLGERRPLFASQVLWLPRGAVDDVIGWRRRPGEALSDTALTGTGA